MSAGRASCPFETQRGSEGDLTDFDSRILACSLEQRAISSVLVWRRGRLGAAQDLSAGHGAQ